MCLLPMQRYIFFYEPVVYMCLYVVFLCTYFPPSMHVLTSCTYIPFMAVQSGCSCLHVYLFWGLRGVCELLSVVKFVLGLKYWVVCVVLMQVIPTDFKNVIYFQGIQLSALPSCRYDLYGIFHCSICMSCV